MEELISLFVFQQRLDSKKKMEESQKSKKMKESVPFNKQTTTEQEELSFTKQMLVLYN